MADKDIGAQVKATSGKKVVKFKNLVGFEEHYPTGALQAVLEGVSGHYRLGDQRFVTTSAVVKIDYSEDGMQPIRIETLNTVYEKE